MQTWAIVAIIAVIAADVIFELYSRNRQNSLSKKAMELMMEGKYSEVEELADSKEMMRSFPPYNRLYLKLNCAMMQQKNKETEALLKEFETIRMNDSQKTALYSMAFQYYLPLEEQSLCADYKLKIDGLKGSEKLKKYADRAYDVVYKKDTSHLEELKAETAALPIEQRGSNDYLIAQIYKNLGDQDNQQAWMMQMQKDLAAAVDSSRNQSQQQNQ